MRADARRAASRKSSPASVVSRLAEPTDRKELLDTPGPYQVPPEPYACRKVPYVFRTTQRFPPVDPPKSDSLDVHPASVEPKLPVAIINRAERWRDAAGGFGHLTYDVDRSLSYLDQRTFAATFSTMERHLAEEADRSAPSASRLESSPLVDPLAIGNSTIPGGVIAGGHRDTIESFLLRSESPGPIYHPSYRQVTPNNDGGAFSTQPRELPLRQVGPGPLAYADCVAKEHLLSTVSRAPRVVFSRAPGCSTFPMPFTPLNVWNSRSMRTAFCVSNAAEKQLERQRSFIEFMASRNAAARDTPKDKAGEPASHTAARQSKRRLCRHQQALQGFSPSQPWDSPFAVRRIFPQTGNAPQASASTLHHRDISLDPCEPIAVVDDDDGGRGTNLPPPRATQSSATEMPPHAVLDNGDPDVALQVARSEGASFALWASRDAAKCQLRPGTGHTKNDRPEDCFFDGSSCLKNRPHSALRTRVESRHSVISGTSPKSHAETKEDEPGRDAKRHLLPQFPHRFVFSVKYPDFVVNCRSP
mgnify:CR=1 FL=1